MKWFGQNHFEKFAYFNFDERTELNNFFKTNKDTNLILDTLSLISGITFDKNSLLTLDEIQECPEAFDLKF